MRWREDDVAYGLVVVWALAGIAWKRLGTDPGVPSVGIAAIVLAVAVVVVLAVGGRARRGTDAA